LKVRVQRADKARELPVTLVSYPDDAEVRRRDADALGLVVAPIPEKLASELTLGPGEGVLVKEVRDNGLAALVGLRQGDIVMQVNYEPVRDGPEGFKKLVASVPEGHPLALTVRRGERFMFKVFPP
jgi:S1-C subfamily serine protease